jgi:putative transposase
MRCINCLSTRTVRNGFDNKGIQRYKCNDCGKRYCARGFFARFKHKPKDIINTVFLRLKRLSLRETSDAIARLIYVHVSHVTVWNWCMKFISLLVLWASLIDPDYEKIWHVDEKFIKVRGSKDKFAYLFVVCDSKNKILAVYVANARTRKSAKEVLRRARTNDNPEIIVTDGMQGYKKACKIFGRKVKHVTAHFKAEGVVHNGKILLLSNNRIERINSDIDLFLHVFRGLKSFRTAQIWLEGFMVYHNYLKPSKISWHKIPKMITSRREVIPNIIFCVYLSPFQLTESDIGIFIK